MALPGAFILILNYNGWRDTVECLESVQRLTYPNYRIVVIDNGSTDGSMDRIKDWAVGELTVESNFFTYDPSTKPVRWIEYDRATAEAGGLPELEAEIETLPSNRRMVLIQTGANLGYAGGNNVGIRYALKRGADYVWLLNNDTVVDRDALTEMVGLVESNRKTGIVGSKLLYYDKPTIIQAAGGGRFNFWTGLARHYGWLDPDDGRWDRPFSPHYVTGASMLVKRQCFEDVGLLDESFFLYGEEVDWQLRARKIGWETMYCPTSVVYHKEGGTAGYKSPLAEFYGTRANVWVCRRHAPWSLPTAAICNFLRALRRMVAGHPERAWAVLRGLAAALTAWQPSQGRLR